MAGVTLVNMEGVGRGVFLGDLVALEKSWKMKSWKSLGNDRIREDTHQPLGAPVSCMREGNAWQKGLEREGWATPEEPGQR